MTTPDTAGAGQPADGGALRGMHLLLLDDRPAPAQALRTLLLPLGVALSVAPTLAQAAQQLREQRLDALLFGLALPLADARAAVTMLRDASQTRGLAVLALGTLSGQDAQAAGMSGHLLLPLDATVVVATLLRHGVAPAEPPSAPQLPVLPGIDAHAGLASCNGAKALYDKLLAMFLRTRGNAVEQLQDMLARQDTHAMRGLLHNLKSDAGLIGAHGLRAAAITLEAQLPNASEHDLPALCTDTQRALAEVLDGLRRHLQP